MFTPKEELQALAKMIEAVTVEGNRSPLEVIGAKVSALSDKVRNQDIQAEILAFGEIIMSLGSVEVDNFGIATDYIAYELDKVAESMQ